MAELTSKKARSAYAQVMGFNYEMDTGRVQFEKDLKDLIRAVQDETELALMRGATPHLGEKHMLLSAIYSALSLCCRPVHREAAYTTARDALDKYLGVELKPLTTARPRRKLLPHV